MSENSQQRRPHPTDGRRALIDITDLGRSLIADNAQEATRIYQDLEATFGEDKMNVLLDLLNELVDGEIED